ncbi:MAG: family 20 glycosylhydrolase [bacterium]
MHNPLSVRPASRRDHRADLAIALTLCCALGAPRDAMAQRTSAVAIIPYPASVTVDSSVRFVLGPVASIALSAPANGELRTLARVASGVLSEELGARSSVATHRAGAGTASTLSLVLAPADSAAGLESYRFDVTARGITIAAPRAAGLFYGIQTLRSLLQAERARTDTVAGAAAPRQATLRGIHIADAPRFSYRGLHLDVGRHFFDAQFVKRFIDVMSRYKYNTFHWHLTEDQGWRIEIKKYPRLTQIGSCRKESLVGRGRGPYVGDGVPHCGFYTQAQIRDVVAYAKAHHVTIIPEIEMPGHSKAVLAAYPELGCTPGPFEVRTRWGVDEDIVCPSEKTFEFEQNVLSEVIDLFPGTYIHIGGDEAPKARWQASELAQSVIKREGLKDEHELQSYFIRRIEKYLTSRGRRLIGWDEILEGGLAPQATVMSWRGIAGGIAAARANHDVIMTPGSHTYFDHTEGDERFEPLNIGGYLPIDTVYSYEPIPADSLTADQARHILGAQAQHWTEFMASTQQVEYMAYPRALAMAEVLWTPKALRDWEGFRRRLLPSILALDALGVRNRFPDVHGLERSRTVTGDTLLLDLRTAIPEAEIRYTIDGRDPSRASTLYTGPVRLAFPADSVQVIARAFLGDRRVSPARAAIFRRQKP